MSVLMIPLSVGLQRQDVKCAPHPSVVVFGLEVQTSNHIDPHHALLGPTLRELPKLPGWGGNPRVVRERVHFKRTLKNIMIL